jgi:antitoxin component HigA of HigAB toxin-antitoxin module
MIAITTEEQYKQLLVEVTDLIGGNPEATPESADGQRIQELAEAIEAWEIVHFPFDEPQSD